jgi:radical SAM protein with 4Fe4S-binding SPASM domain
MTECSFSEINVVDLLEKLESTKPPGMRIPYFGTLELTPDCNVKCVHCYVTHCEHDEKIIDYTETCRILDEVAQEGCVWLLLTGGEPLLRKDFSDIYTYAKKKGFILTLFTNGSLVTPAIAGLLHELPPKMVEISIYGATKETHERITGVAGSFERSLRGIKLLLEQNIKVTLKTMAMTLNKHEINDMHALASSLGVKFRFDPILNPGLDGSRQPCEYRLSPEEVVKLDREDPERAKEWTATFQRLDRRPFLSEALYTCGAGKGRFHIDAFGKLQLCTIARKPEYDLRKGSFHDGWYNFVPSVSAQKLTRSSACRTCEERGICNICPGWNLMEYDALDSQPVEYLCQIAHLRTEAFDTLKKETR